MTKQCWHLSTLTEIDIPLSAPTPLVRDCYNWNNLCCYSQLWRSRIRHQDFFFWQKCQKWPDVQLAKPFHKMQDPKRWHSWYLSALYRDLLRALRPGQAARSRAWWFYEQLICQVHKFVVSFCYSIQPFFLINLFDYSIKKKSDYEALRNWGFW